LDFFDVDERGIGATDEEASLDESTIDSLIGSLERDWFIDGFINFRRDSFINWFLGSLIGSLIGSFTSFFALDFDFLTGSATTSGTTATSAELSSTIFLAFDFDF